MSMGIQIQIEGCDRLYGSTFHGIYVLSIDVESQRDRDSSFVRRSVEGLGEGSRHVVNCKRDKGERKVDDRCHSTASQLLIADG